HALTYPRAHLLRVIQAARAPAGALLGRDRRDTWDQLTDFLTQRLVGRGEHKWNVVVSGIDGELRGLTGIAAVHSKSGQRLGHLGVIEKAVDGARHRVLTDHRHGIDLLIVPLEARGVQLRYRDR